MGGGGGSGQGRRHGVAAGGSAWGALRAAWGCVGWSWGRGPCGWGKGVEGRWRGRLYQPSSLGIAGPFPGPWRPVLGGRGVPGDGAWHWDVRAPDTVSTPPIGSARALSSGASHPAPSPWVELGSTQGVVWCGVVWCGVAWCGVVWCGVVWCGVVWCGTIPSHQMCLLSRAQVVQALVGRGCSPDVRIEGWSALLLAVVHRQEAVVQTLVPHSHGLERSVTEWEELWAQGATCDAASGECTLDPEAEQAMRNGPQRALGLPSGTTVLELAADRRLPGSVKAMSAALGPPVGTSDADPLLCLRACCAAAPAARAQALAAAIREPGADVAALGPGGWSCLMAAAVWRDEALVRELLKVAPKKSALLTRTTTEGCSALMWATWAQADAIVALLAAEGLTHSTADSAALERLQSAWDAGDARARSLLRCAPSAGLALCPAPGTPHPVASLQALMRHGTLLHVADEDPDAPPALEGALEEFLASLTPEELGAPPGYDSAAVLIDSAKLFVQRYVAGGGTADPETTFALHLATVDLGLWARCCEALHAGALGRWGPAVEHLQRALQLLPPSPCVVYRAGPALPNAELLQRYQSGCDVRWTGFSTGSLDWEIALFGADQQASGREQGAFQWTTVFLVLRNGRRARPPSGGQLTRSICPQPPSVGFAATAEPPSVVS